MVVAYTVVVGREGSSPGPWGGLAGAPQERPAGRLTHTTRRSVVSECILQNLGQKRNRTAKEAVGALDSKGVKELLKD